MQPRTPQWSPRVGDRVHIKGTTTDAQVCRVTGRGEDRRYLLDTTASTGAHTTYSIAEIRPSS